ncbi:transcriptional repressor [soil metagenome]
MAQQTTDWTEHANRSLSEAGHRAGGARATVVDALGGQHCCLSAQELSEQLRGSGSRIGLASIYRALDVLHGLGLVQRVDLGDGELRFEPIRPGGEHHHHAVCESCGEVTAFEDPRLEADLARVGKGLGHTIDAHEVVIHGTCAGCAPRG